jgi:hypothetical protein
MNEQKATNKFSVTVGCEKYRYGYAELKAVNNE